MNSKKVIQLLYIHMLFFGGIYLSCQPAWTLQQCMDYAHSHNLNVLQSKGNIESAAIDVKQSNDNFLPSINGSMGQNLNLGRSVDFVTYDVVTQAINSSTLGLNASYSLYEGNRRKLTRTNSNLQLESAKLNESSLLLNIDLSIINAYLQILRAEEQKQVFVTQAALTKDRIAQTQKLIDAGVLPSGDILPLKSQEANDNLGIVRADNAIASAYLLLAQSMDYYDPIKVVKPVTEADMNKLDELSLSTLLQTAADRRPEVKAAELDQKIAETNIGIAKSAKMPSIGLVGSLSTRYSSLGKSITGQQTLVTPIGYVASSNELVYSALSQPVYEKTGFFKQFSDNLNFGVGINVGIPIFNNFQVKNNIAKTQIAIKMAELRKQSAIRNSDKTVRDSYLNAINARQSLQASQVAVDAATQAFMNSQKKYGVGLINQYEINQSQNNVTNAELNLRSAKYDYIFMLLILDYLQGKPLQF